MLAEFLAEQLFGRWSLVLHYDLGRGLRVVAGRDEQRLKEMVALANRKVGDLSALPKDPAATFALLDRFVRNNIMAAEDDRLSVAVIIDQASYVFPVGRAWPPEPAGVVAARDDAQLGDEPARQAAEHGVRAGRREAGRPQRSADRQPARGDDRSAAAGRTGARAFIDATVDAATLAEFSDFDAAQLATLTAGISLTDLNVLVQSAREGGAGSTRRCSAR